MYSEMIKHNYYINNELIKSLDIKKLDDSIEEAKKLLVEHNVKEVVIRTEFDEFVVRPPKTKKQINTPDKV